MLTESEKLAISSGFLNGAWTDYAAPAPRQEESPAIMPSLPFTPRKVINSKAEKIAKFERLHKWLKAKKLARKQHRRKFLKQNAANKLRAGTQPPAGPAQAQARFTNEEDVQNWVYGTIRPEVLSVLAEKL